MKKILQYFKQDNTSCGAIAAATVMIVPALLLWLVLMLINEPVLPHIGWFAGSALLGLLVVRYYAKAKCYPAALKGAIVTLFLLFIAYMALFLKNSGQ